MADIEPPTSDAPPAMATFLMTLPVAAAAK